MGIKQKNGGQDWPDPCIACNVILCIERGRPPSEVVSCVPKVHWNKHHMVLGGRGRVLVKRGELIGESER